MGTCSTIVKRRDSSRSAQYEILNTPRKHEDVSRFASTLLVAKHEERGYRMRQQMSNLSESQGRASTTQRVITAIGDSRMEMGARHDGFCGRTSSDTEGL